MNPFYSVPEDSEPDDPNPGVRYVVYLKRFRLGELASIIASCHGKTVVQPQPLNRFDSYLTAEIPYGRTREFLECLFEEGIRTA